VDNVEPIVDPNEQVVDIINDVFPFASTNINQEGEDDVPTPIDSAEFEQYEQLLKNANQELYPVCKSFFVLTAIVELMHGKIKYRMSNLCFDYFLGAFKRMLLTDNCLPKDHRHAQKVNKLKSSNSPTYSEELYNLAFGPIRTELFSGCHVNGVKFLGTARDDMLCTQSSGVHVLGGGESTDINFYGKLTTVIVYLDDPKAGNGWKVVQKMDQRNVYAIPELDPTDNDIDNVANQRLESSMENDVEKLRDSNVIQEPFQLQGVSSIEIPIQSITIDLGNLPRYDVPVGPNYESDEEEDWETESDGSDDNESYHSSDD
ncbi:unnamed protein product, partial [Prunus brigantina]